ncbi:MAG: RNA methyltransferase [Bacteroidetes bacterium GWF2_43_63]|nr:MAG: RNA methyltransferase [Bacteroidetes bacterium GWE2_42_42]OFY52784.1 MAG: RNA methyltransferase [Bacteroidetes bacterium GWF2_43_63]HBG70012.1 RNA methyltransferase [Bacteroidales bacterium]HCB62383.1 RNA methyltransferase [Bacteroidales bacterium]HCY22430.1 RNA methyltransferase [Bacteroidales bacterium]
MKKSMSDLGRMTQEEFREAPKLPLVVLLDNVRSQHNIGSVFRTSDAFRVSEIILCGITATPPNKEIQKTALGATESVAWRYFENASEAVAQLKQEGFTVVAVEQTHNSLIINTEEWIFPDEKIALVLGNEVFGTSDEVLELCDRTIEIPQFGTKHSLNVSVCAGIVIWEICKWHLEHKTRQL